MGRWFDRVLGVVVLLGLSAVLMGPDGALRRHVDEFVSERRAEAVLLDHWNEISAAASTDAGERVLVEFMDYQCPFCRRAEDPLTEIAASEGFAVVYRHFPLTRLHPRAEEAARAAICAEEIGVFPEAHEYLISEEWWEDSTDLSTRWSEFSVPESDSTTFRRCLTSEAVEQRLNKDRELGELLGVRATPTFVGPEGLQVGFPGRSGVMRLLGSGAADQG